MSTVMCLPACLFFNAKGRKKMQAKRAGSTKRRGQAKRAKENFCLPVLSRFLPRLRWKQSIVSVDLLVLWFAIFGMCRFLVCLHCQPCTLCPVKISFNLSKLETFVYIRWTGRKYKVRKPVHVPFGVRSTCTVQFSEMSLPWNSNTLYVAISCQSVLFWMQSFWSYCTETLSTASGKRSLRSWC